MELDIPALREAVADRFQFIRSHVREWGWREIIVAEGEDDRPSVIAIYDAGDSYSVEFRIFIWGRQPFDVRSLATSYKNQIAQIHYIVLPNTRDEVEFNNSDAGNLIRIESLPAAVETVEEVEIRASQGLIRAVSDAGIMYGGYYRDHNDNFWKYRTALLRNRKLISFEIWDGVGIVQNNNTPLHSDSQNCGEFLRRFREENLGLLIRE